MLKVLDTGAIGPLQPKSSKITICLLIAACCVFATTQGYDSALMNGINIMPQYTAWFKLTTATKALNTCANFIGWGIAALFMGPVVEHVGRKGGVVLSVVLKLIGILLMSAAQNVLMFVFGRIVLGWGTGTAAIGASTWLAETLPPKIRGLGLSITYSVFFVGALMASGVCYGTANIAGPWSWRLPCALQAVYSVGCFSVLWFTPESPRWLAYHGREDEALIVIASIYANGDRTDPEVLIQHRQMVDTLEWERNSGKKLTYKEMFRTPNARKRIMLCMSVAIIGMMSGNNIISYYLGDMLGQAGISSAHTKLKINIVLNSWSLICAGIGTCLMDKAGRKSLCLAACCGMTVFLFLVGALTKLYGTGSNISGVYGTIAMIFLFQGSYSIGITPVTQLYPPEVMNYSIRTNGMALWALCINLAGLFTTFVFPFALEAISWKLYMINGAWDVLEALFVAFFWVETKGLTLEEIDSLIDENSDDSSPDVEGIKSRGEILEGVDVKQEADIGIVGIRSDEKASGT